MSHSSRWPSEQRWPFLNVEQYARNWSTVAKVCLEKVCGVLRLGLEEDLRQPRAFMWQFVGLIVYLI